MTSTARPSRDRSTGRGAARAVGTVAVAVISAAAALGLAVATGALHTNSTTVKSVTVPGSGAQSLDGSGVVSERWAAIYARTNPSVVDIASQVTTTVNTPLGPQEQHATDFGAGIVIDTRGDLVTAAHLVSGASSVKVTLPGGVTRGAKVLGADYSADVALLHISNAGLALHPVTLGSDRTLAVGDQVGMIGDPLGFDRSLSTGVVSALDRTIEAPDGFTIAHAIQTDAALNPGNSGGPMLDTRGEVVGIADQIATGTNQFGRSSTETSTGVGFAVPIDLATADLAQLKRGERVKHAYLGVSTSTSQASGQPGALVAEVRSGTPAAKAGVRAGDVIVAMNGRAINNANGLIDSLATAHAGEHVALSVVRGSRRLTVPVTLSTQPEQAPTE
jgi:putative serine protease PepD